MSTQLVKAALNVFIMIAVIVSIVQDLRNVNSVSNEVQAQKQNETLISSQPQIAGVVIKASDNLIKPVHELLKKQEYNVKVEPYSFEGNQWWWESGIQYGHIIIVYTLFGKYQSEADQTKKRRLMMIGCIVLFLWFTVLPKYKIDRLKIEVKNQTVYENTIIVPNQIITSLTDGLDIVELQNFNDIPSSHKHKQQPQTVRTNRPSQDDEIEQQEEIGQFGDQELF